MPTKKCDRCEMEFADQKALNKHALAVHPIKCDQCDKKLTDFKGLRQHVLAVHLKVNLVQRLGVQTSKIAGKVTKKKKNAKEIVQCNKCGKNFPNRGEMLAHYTYIHSRGMKPSCEKCGKEFVFEDACRKHERQCQKRGTNDEKKEPSEVNDEEPVEIEKELFDKNELFTRKISFCPLCDVRGWSEDKIREHLQEFHKARSESLEVKTM